MHAETLKRANSLFERIELIIKNVNEIETTIAKVKNGLNKMGNIITIYGLMFPIDNQIGISLLEERLKEIKESLKELEEEFQSL